MRLWSIHPKYLDRAGLVALWREGLLAKKVLEGSTKGYKNHPQLDRFKMTSDPLAAINNYLHAVVDEAMARGYKFDARKLASKENLGWEILITNGQVDYEVSHLLKKLKLRDQTLYKQLKQITDFDEHPLFTVIPGPIAVWEKH